LVQSILLVAAYAFAEASSNPAVTTNRDAATTGRSLFITVVLLLENLAKSTEVFQKPKSPKRAAIPRNTGNEQISASRLLKHGFNGPAPSLLSLPSSHAASRDTPRQEKTAR
jgi:hypothetical protein